jgi:hypothetical protein
LRFPPPREILGRLSFAISAGQVFAVINGDAIMTREQWEQAKRADSDKAVKALQLAIDKARDAFKQINSRIWRRI